MEVCALQRAYYIFGFANFFFHFEDFTTILKLIQIEEEVLFTKGILGFAKQLAVLDEERETVNTLIRNLNRFRLMRAQIRELQYYDLSYKDISNHPLFF